jgi:cell division GTPase FtsZ
MSVKRIDFTKDERYAIAEYVYSQETDILIINDATRLLDVLNKHNLLDNYESLTRSVENKVSGIIGAITNILYLKVSAEQIEEIMKEYYGIGTITN